MNEEPAAQQLWTEDLRSRILEESEKNLFFFARAVCGYKDITDTHKELCECLDGRGDWGEWRRGVVACHRGWIKTSLVRAWALREALHRVNWTCRYLGSTFENASIHFLEPIKNLFLESDRKEWVKFLYRHRIPAGFAGWTDRQIVFLRTDANAPPAISIKGISSDQEGYHGNGIIIDDPEGAEAEKSEISQIDAIRVVSNATPLLINPGMDRILLVGTVHGADPVVYRALYENFNVEEMAPKGEFTWDNSKRVWKQFWRPIYGADGKPVFPYSADGTPRFTEEIIEIIRRGNSLMWRQQYLLLRSGQGTGNWSKRLIEKNFAAWKGSGGNVGSPGTDDQKVVRYKAVKIDMKKWREKGEFEVSEVWRECRASEMFYYLALDPKHKAFTTSYQRAKVRPSAAAAVLLGVSPDNHIFVLRRWMKKDASLEDQLEQVLKLHLEWGARKFIIETIGAQAWLKSILEIREDSNPLYQNPYAKSVWGEKRWLPRLSSLVEEDKRSPKMDKEEHIYHRLDPLIAEGRFHTFADQDDINEQLIGFPDSTEYVDLVDATAMAIPYISPPLGSEEQQRAREEQKLLREIGKTYATYDSPLRKKRLPRRQTHPGWDRNTA